MDQKDTSEIWLVAPVGAGTEVAEKYVAMRRNAVRKDQKFVELDTLMWFAPDRPQWNPEQDLLLNWVAIEKKTLMAA